jgi:hypothetical protein
MTGAGTPNVIISDIGVGKWPVARQPARLQARKDGRRQHRFPLRRTPGGVTTMQMTKTRSRIAALAGAAALAATLGAVSAPAAQATTDIYIRNAASHYCVLSQGLAAAVILSSSDQCTVFEPQDETVALGVDWWEYKAVGTSLCLQAKAA